MSAWADADQPRVKWGRYGTKHRSEPAEVALMVSTPTKSPNGDIEWRTEYQRLHRVGGPAVIRSDGSESWWEDGGLHRIGGPAVDRPDGPKEWWVNGERHRDDGPAYTEPDGTEAWWSNGVLHRTDGPAASWPDGRLQWWENGERKPPEVEAALTMMWKARTPEGA